MEFLFQSPCLCIFSTAALFLSDPLQDDSGSLCPSVDEKQEEEKTQEKHKNKKGSVNKVPKPKHERRGDSAFI